MKIIFCHDPVQTASPDPMFIDEVAAATRAGLSFELIDYEAIARHNNAARAVREIPVYDQPILALYRGWELRADQYAQLVDALLSRGIQLITTASQFNQCHFLPEALPIIKPYTPRTIWMKTSGQRINYDAVMQSLLPFGSQPIIVRDFAHAEKHYWSDACYISNASDRAIVQRVTEHFLALRGIDLEGGLVFREYVDLETIGEPAASGKSLTKELRIFFWSGFPVLTLGNWDANEELPLEQFTEIARHVRNRFFTMDIAQRADGEWIIIDLDDAQVAKLPFDADLDGLYQMIASG